MPVKSEAQRRAMWAAREGRSTLGIPKSVAEKFVGPNAHDANLPIAAGTAFVSPESKVLLLKRAGVPGKDNYVGHWSLPGGKGEPGETPEQTADRESAEELGNTAPVSRKKLLDRVKTPNGMIFHTFAQPVHSEFQPQLNEEHSEHGWFALNELPSPLHPSVGRVLRENLGVAEDMVPEDWTALRENFAKWTREEEAEGEHAEDNQPMLATAANTGMPAFIKSWNKKAKDEAARAKDADVCPTCGGTGELAGPGMVCEDCGGTGKVRAKDCAFDMARFMRNLAGDEGFREDEHPRAPDGKFGSGSGGSKSASGGAEKAKGALKMSALTKKGGKLGTNEGGLYEGEKGEKFYIKKPGSKAHVKNERQAAALYQLAGAKTLDYRDVEGGEHVATEWKQLEKKNISEFTPAERKEAAKDFAIHAWLSNWDAAGTGGDNQGVLGGKTTTLDVGGSLRFRAQGGPKGDAFGDKVTEWENMRNKGKSPDAARLFAPMTESELRASVERVAAIPDAKIRAAVGDDKELADRLIARKKDLVAKVGLESKTEEAKPTEKSDEKQSPFEGKKGSFKQIGKANLKDQGFKPRKRGTGNDMTQVAQVAWSHAIATGKTQILTPSTGKNSWVFVGPKADMPYGQPHLLVDPDGTVTSYKPHFGGAKDGALDSMFLALDSRKAPEHTLLVKYDGDFSFKGLLGHLQRLGAIGASRTIEARDEDDKIVPFGWDGDGADKIWSAELDGEQLAFDRVMVMGLHREGMAFDRATESVRSVDADGRMHVEVSNISKAIVNPYLGKEIPKYKELGLDPNRVYKLLRDPEELKKGAATFNNLPLLDKHVGVNAADHKPEHVIGSTGTDAEFEHPHLKNSLVVWADRGIKAIESKKKKELSSAYRYRADMTPGDYEGVRYDGVMRDIVGNHVALVEEGRAGPDVVVGDSANPLTQERTMKVKLSPLGTVAYGALMTFLKPQMAMDSSIDLKRGLRSITAKNFKAKRPVLAAWISESVKDKLDPEYAQDGALNTDGLDAVLDMVQLAADDFPEEMKEKMEEKKKGKDEKPKAGARDEDMEDEDADMAGDEDDDAETDEEKEARMKKRADDKKARDRKAKDAKRAKDKDVNEEDEEHDPKTPEETANDEDDEEKDKAMDAQIEAGIAAGIKKERARMEAVSAAKEHVRARVGNLVMAFDSAADVYRKALVMATGKEPPKKADADTLKYAFDSLPSKDKSARQTYAMDSAGSSTARTDIAKRNPELSKNMARIGRA